MAKTETKSTKFSSEVHDTSKVNTHVPGARETPAPVIRDPLKVVGLETTVPGVYTYLNDADVPGAFETGLDDEGKTIRTHARAIVVGNKHYEHTTEDADGCWIYRQM